jgi:hypothetical protein
MNAKYNGTLNDAEDIKMRTLVHVIAPACRRSGRYKMRRVASAPGRGRIQRWYFNVSATILVAIFIMTFERTAI